MSGSGAPLQRRQANRQNHPKIRDRQSAIDHAVRVIYLVCCLAGSPNLIDEIRADLDADGVRAAMRKRDTGPVFDWLIAALSYQGISDQIASAYMEQHGYANWADINQSVGRGATCPKLKSYWHFHECHYSKLRQTCGQPNHISGCPIPTHDLRNGRLNQTAYALYLFIRDFADGDLISWIDQRLQAAKSPAGPPAARAAKAATSNIPIVFTSGDDPVIAGLVASMNRPGGNVTGVHILFTELETKKLGLLRELMPQAALIAVLLNPNFPSIETQTRELHSAAHALGQPIQIFTAGSERELDAAFASMRQLRVGALLVGADPFFASRRTQIVTLAARHSVPVVYEQRAFTEAGGLMSYGTDIAEGYRQAGRYTGRILKGEKPADLPVVQLSKFELVINLKTAKALGITIPPGVLAIADEVIE